jgi:hypothetical protein
MTVNFQKKSLRSKTLTVKTLISTDPYPVLSHRKSASNIVVTHNFTKTEFPLNESLRGEQLYEPQGTSIRLSRVTGQRSPLSMLRLCHNQL